MENFSQIIETINSRELTLSEYSCKSEKAIRMLPENNSKDISLRPPFFRDSDRILHSRAYTRYIDKTQVFSLFENDHITHRSLHVQFVSKIGRTIARCLNLNEDLVEAISLGHDIGHAPFGHDGELYLNELCQLNNIGHFIHSAQSVRTMMELENNSNGLNLTVQVLDGFLCHNGELLSESYYPDYTKDADRFLEEYRKSFVIKDYYKNLVPMTLEGCVMRISDIIAYIGRDFEDAIRLRLINRSDIPEIIVRVLGNSNNTIIDTLVKDLVANSFGKDHLCFSKDVHNALENLTKFNYERIYCNPIIKTESLKIKAMFFNLFEKVAGDIKNNNKQSPIFDYFIIQKNDNYLLNNPPERIAVDFIASMTDDFLVNIYSELFIPKRLGYYVKSNDGD